MLSPGDRLGPYEVVSPLGAGGMGEVYRARDTRLGRDVALKILPEGRSSDPDRLRRFETEARAVASLNHPHILALFDVGTHDGVPYAVTELLEGSTLRRVLERGPLPFRKVVDYGVQICRGLAAAHERGVVHRDLKPENLFLTQDGQIKILDFGLAKLMDGGEGNDTGESQLPTATDPGVVMGTAGYMSPEQARGQAADARSDLFSLGAVLYEALSGRRAFAGDTAADTVSAILTHDPPEITNAVTPVPTGLERVVRRCLEKDPRERFHSTMDVAFALEALSGTSGVGIDTPLVERGRRPWIPGLVVVLVLLVSVGAAWLIGRGAGERPFPTIHQLTYRRGMVDNARFVPGGGSVLYTGLWDGRPPEIFELRLEDAESTPLGLTHAQLQAVSSTAELAILLGRDDESGYFETGTLARVPLSGGKPRALLEHVIAADWSPDGQELAVLRAEGHGFPRLEYPIGAVLLHELREYRPWGTRLRVSPEGERVAVGVQGGILVIDRSGQQTLLRAPAEGSVDGIAWDPSGEVLWLTSCAPRPNCGIWRLSLDGELHELYRAAGLAWLHDVSADGRVLVHHGAERQGIRVKPPGEVPERELELHGWSNPWDLSADGLQVLTGEWSRVGTQDKQALFIRPTSGGPATRLSTDILSGMAKLSPDGQWTLRWTANPNRLTLAPTGPGDPRDLPTERFESLMYGFFPGNQKIMLFTGEPGRPPRGWLGEPEGKDWRPVTPEGVVPGWFRWPQNEVVGPDMAGGAWAAYPLGGGAPRALPLTLSRSLQPILYGTTDGRFGFLLRRSVPPVLERVDLDTGERTPWRTLQPGDTTGLGFVVDMFVRPDVEAYAYSYVRLFQDLYLIEGLE